MKELTQLNITIKFQLTIVGTSIAEIYQPEMTADDAHQGRGEDFGR
jgi:hypothetical protein